MFGHKWQVVMELWSCAARDDDVITSSYVVNDTGYMYMVLSGGFLASSVNGVVDMVVY